MSLSNTFYRYARLSKGRRQRLGYWGVYDLPQDSTSGTGPVEILPGDATTTVIPPQIIYPQPTDIYDLPGRIGGPLADGDNSLSYGGSANNIAAPMTLDLTVPDHTIGALTLSLGDLASIKPSLQGEVATVTLFVISRYVTTSVVAKLVSGSVTMEYWNGAGYVAGTEVYGWEGGAQMTYNVTLAAAETDQLKFKVQFNTGFSVVAADYEFFVSVQVGGVVVAESVAVAAVS